MQSFSHLTLSTQRLLLRPLRAADGPGVMALFTDTAFMRFGTSPPFSSMEEAHALIARDMQAMASGERLRFGIERLADGALIGICTLFNLDGPCRSAEIGYGLYSDAWGNGYMHEALVALLDHGFRELGLNRVEADMDPHNTRSAKSLVRAGFSQEGLLRESCLVNGVLTDSARYGLLQRDWAACPRPSLQSPPLTPIGEGKSHIRVTHTSTGIHADAERILRSLPQWFGVEDALRDYVRDTSLHPTFVTRVDDQVCGFITMKQHFPASAEIHCIAVEASSRGQGVGRALVQHARTWAAARGARFLQVKTLAESHPSPAYAETRAFYLHMGFVPLEVFPSLWSRQNPCLQMIKQLP